MQCASRHCLSQRCCYVRLAQVRMQAALDVWFQGMRVPPVDLPGTPFNKALQVGNVHAMYLIMYMRRCHHAACIWLVKGEGPAGAPACRTSPGAQRNNMLSNPPCGGAAATPP